MMRSYLLALLLLLSPAVLLAQPDADAAADSLVARDSSLFTFPPPVPPSESIPDDWLRPAGWSPEFPTPYRRLDFLGLEDSPAMLLSYDRADGLYLGGGSNVPAPIFLTRRFQGYIGLGYSFGSHYWQVQGGIKKDFLARAAPLRLSLEGHIMTDTRDAWKMGVTENTMFAALAGVDARDYYQRRGFSVGLQQFLNRRVGVKGEYRLDNYRSSRREVGWSLFGPEQPFREVPPIREGRMSSVVVNVIADYTSLRSWNDGLFSLEGQAEFGSLEGSFQQYVLDVRAKGTLVRDWLWVGGRLRFGSATGDAPPQKLFTIGGYGTLPGFEQNAYGGNRLLLLQTDLIFSPFNPFGLRLIFENNFGAVGQAASTAGMLAGFPDAGSFKYSTGIYVGAATGVFRMGFAFRTDVFADPEFVVRLARPF